MTNNENPIDLQPAIDILRDVQLTLLGIDEEELDQAQKNELANNLSLCGNAIRSLQAADFANLSAEFAEKEADLRQASAELENDLRELNDAVSVLTTISAGLNTITGFIDLL